MVSDWLNSSLLSRHTQRAYRNEVERLTTYLKDRRVLLSDLQVRHLNRFWAQLVEGRMHKVDHPPSAGSMQQSRRILSAYLRWCVSQKIVGPGALAALDLWDVKATPADNLPPVPSRSSASVYLLLSVKDMDAAAAALSFWTGASPQELAQIESSEFDWQCSEATIKRRNSDSTIALPRKLSASLRHLVKEEQPYFFGGEEPSTAAEMAGRIARWGKRHGVNTVSARSLRAQFLKLASDAGWRPDEIRNQLRRCDLDLPPTPPPSAGRLALLQKAVSKLGVISCST